MRGKWKEKQKKKKKKVVNNVGRYVQSIAELTMYTNSYHYSAFAFVSSVIVFDVELSLFELHI